MECEQLVQLGGNLTEQEHSASCAIVDVSARYYLVVTHREHPGFFFLLSDASPLDQRLHVHLGRRSGYRSGVRQS